MTINKKEVIIRLSGFEFLSHYQILEVADYDNEIRTFNI